MSDLQPPPIAERRLPVVIMILVGWFGIATIEGVVLLATWAAFDAMNGPCTVDCPTTLMDALRAHRATPVLFRFTLENTGIAALIVGALALVYRKRAAAVFRLALLSGGLVCALFGALFLVFAFQGGDLATEIGSAAIWITVGVGALQIRQQMLKVARSASIATINQ